MSEILTLAERYPGKAWREVAELLDRENTIMREHDCLALDAERDAEIAALRAEVSTLTAMTEGFTLEGVQHYPMSRTGKHDPLVCVGCLRAEVERVTDVAYAHCSRADAREADIERITAHYAGAMELASRKVSLMTELLRRAVPLVAFCAPKDSTLAEDIRKAIHE